MTGAASAPAETRCRQTAAACHPPGVIARSEATKQSRPVRQAGTRLLRCARNDESLREQGQDAGMAVEPVARDLAIGEKPDQREIAEGLADQPGLDPLLAEQRRAARDAADIDPGLRRPGQPAAELLQHADEIGL